MSHDNRLSGILHLLLHMAEEPGPHTSETLARAMGTNPVVIRRMMAGLRKGGLVRAARGKGGGWTIAGDSARLTLNDVYMALGEPAIIAMRNRTNAPECLIEQAVNAALSDAFEAAEALLLNRFKEVTLGDLSAEFRNRLSGRSHKISLQSMH
jgi:DNA-binding IscR family transcriptional regulator